MFRIGEFSKLAKTTIKTLRFYDEVGLFSPKFVDDNGYRYYSIESLSILQRILELRSFNISIEEIKEILKGRDIVDVLNTKKVDIEKEIKVQHNNLHLINKFLQDAKKGEFKMQKYDAKEVIIPKYNVFYKHGVIKDYSEINEWVLDAGSEVIKNNPKLECVDGGYCFITYPSEEYKESDIELEYVEAVKVIGQDSENIKFRIEPSIKAIYVDHIGSYDKLREAYAFIVNYVLEKGYKIVAPIRECYIHGIWDCENENDYLTKIQVPIEVF